METLNNTAASNEAKEVKETKKVKEVKPKKEKKVKEKKEKKQRFSYPDAVNVSEISKGTGHLWDTVLEYRVWNDETYKSYIKYDEASKYATENNLKVSVLIEQLPNHWIKESETGISIGTERRTTEWKAEALIATKYSLPRLKRIFLKLMKEYAKDIINTVVKK